MRYLSVNIIYFTKLYNNNGVYVNFDVNFSYLFFHVFNNYPSPGRQQEKSMWRQKYKKLRHLTRFLKRRSLLLIATVGQQIIIVD